VNREAQQDARALVERVFCALADGQFHSGEELARRLGVSRSAVWKAAKTLRELGSTVHAVRNRGYRLAGAGEPLDAVLIRDALARGLRARLRHIEVAWTVTSTNTVLIERGPPPRGECDVALAEFQSAGRGRRGRPWFAPPGGAVCLSMSWTFAQVPRDVGSLSLAIGVCMLRALSRLGVSDLQLKWPNDVLLGDAKLGGILIELRAEAAGPACVVIGIGLNVALGAVLTAQISATGVAAADLTTAGIPRPARNQIAAQIIESCMGGLLDFEREGLRTFMDEWRHADALRGRAVTVLNGDERTRGLARGIDVTGALLVEAPQGLRKFVAGEVSVRPLA
jgi:BirA family transcriptional regulator, biotin operon repressor / biotin---[acetyl-CoA-carboxylase] ligase